MMPKWGIFGVALSAHSLHFLFLDQEWDDRQEEDYLLLERILLLLRNILHVPADPQAEKVQMFPIWCHCFFDYLTEIPSRF